MNEASTNSQTGPARKSLAFNEGLVFELGSAGRRACKVPACDVPETDLNDLLPASEIREPIDGFPELSELEVVRHFTRLSQWNFSIDSNFYPLGSCTMKYNPKINDQLAGRTSFSGSHPYLPEELAQGNLEILFELQEYLKEISGMSSVCLQPAAGAQGELAGMLMIHAYHQERNDQRTKILLPDSAHGTNPASATLCGYRSISLRSGLNGLIDLAKLEELMDEDTAGIMLTNPNTLGMFEKDILAITEIVHKKGGLVYCDGANLNAVMGKTRFAEMGVDVMHFNLHKTFSTPHGGGGPGAGPVGVNKTLEPYLPLPMVEKTSRGFRLKKEGEKSVGRLKNFYGNFGILLRAYAYIRSLGKEGIPETAEMAVLNANYIKAKLKKEYHLPYPNASLHECIFNDKNQGGLSTMDIAKALIDYGFHPPTVYFPLIVKNALMIEPTETESKETLDEFIAAMIEISQKGKQDPHRYHNSPEHAFVSRPDETQAARNPVLRWERNSGSI
jgi:glycine dehydrogenase subunit 2